MSRRRKGVFGTCIVAGLAAGAKLGAGIGIAAAGTAMSGAIPIGLALGAAGVVAGKKINDALDRIENKH